MNQPANSSTASPVTGSALAGKRIVVTRARHQVAEVADLIRDYGADPVLYPCIKIDPPADSAALDSALMAAGAGEFDWLVITSVNTAMILAQRLRALGIILDNLRVAAIGPKTAASVGTWLDVDVDLVASTYVAESLAADLGPAPGQRFLLPQSAIARATLANSLRAVGADVTVVDAYEIAVGEGGADVPSLLAARQIDAITFSSSSTVRYFVQRLQEEGGRLADLDDVCLAAIGPVTAETMRQCGMRVSVVPAQYTVAALIGALEELFRND